MPAITLFNGTYCKEDIIVNKIVEKTGYKLIEDDDVINKASELSNMPATKIKNAFSSKTSVFNKFTHEKERSIAWLRLATAKILLSEDNIIVKGFCGQLIPKDITHVLRICLIAEMKYRIQTGQNEYGLSEKEVNQQIHIDDEDKSSWTNILYKIKDPWDDSLYDILLPVDKTDEEACISLIDDNLKHEVIQATDSSKKAVNDFLIAAKVGVELAKEGHNVDVSSRDGSITIIINKHVLMLNRLEEELKNIAKKVDGVKSIETRVGKGYHQTDIYRKYDFELPKLLLVDDEREFIQTLSERLSMRDLGSAIVYDGESALKFIDEDDPDVMILDLKMPGIDGIEVLKQVKQNRPQIEVIILTGHGSEEDKKICMDLGAFAYMNKPINIEELSDLLKKAKEKMTQNI